MIKDTGTNYTPDKGAANPLRGSRGHAVLAAVILGLTIVFSWGDLVKADTTSGAPNPLAIVEPVEIDRIMPYLDAYLDPTNRFSLDQVRSLPQSAFTPLDGAEPNFGYIESAIWIRLPISNPSADQIDRLLWLQTNFMTELDIYLTDGNAVRHLLSQDISKPFSTRPLRHPNLVAPFSLAPQTRATLWIRYRSQGNTHLPFRIEDQQGFIEASQARNARLFVFYGSAMIFAVIGTFAFAMQRSRIYLFYSLYTVCVILYLMHRDGFGFAYLWPGWPAFNNFISLPLGCAVSFFAAQFTRDFLNTRRELPAADRVLQLSMAISVALVCLPICVSQSAVKQFVSLWAPICALLYFTIGVMSWRRRGPERIFFVMGWGGIVLASIYGYHLNTIEIENSRAAILNVMRIALFFDAAMMGLALLTGHNRLRRQHERARQDQLAALNTNIGLLDRLNRLEQQYETIKRAADARSRAFADATHDIRQPLFALRGSVQSLIGARTVDPDQVKDVSTALLYLETLVQEKLDSALGDDPKGTPERQNHQDAPPVSVVLQAMEQMFAGEARQKSLTFKVRSCAAPFRANALSLTRIVSNIVSNAVKYTQKGGVLIGCRFKNRRLGIEIYDTGPGMDAETFERLRTRTARGDRDQANPAGKGLGLDIIHTLAEQENLLITMRSVPGRGTCFRIEEGS